MAWVELTTYIFVMTLVCMCVVTCEEEICDRWWLQCGSLWWYYRKWCLVCVCVCVCVTSLWPHWCYLESFFSGCQRDILNLALTSSNYLGFTHFLFIWCFSSPRCEKILFMRAAQFTALMLLNGASRLPTISVLYLTFRHVRLSYYNNLYSTHCMHVNTQRKAHTETGGRNLGLSLNTASSPLLGKLREIPFPTISCNHDLAHRGAY